jgi:hypothetical protein
MASTEAIVANFAHARCAEYLMCTPVAYMLGFEKRSHHERGKTAG